MLVLVSVLAKNAGLFIVTLATVLPMNDVLWATAAQTIAGRRGMQARTHAMRVVFCIAPCCGSCSSCRCKLTASLFGDGVPEL